MAAETKHTEPKQDDLASKARILATRNMEMREADIRAQLRMSFLHTLDIPQEMIPEDKQYHWGREAIRNEPDTHRLVQLEQRGFTPVPVDRHPSIVRKRLDGRDSHLNGYIHYNGLILMERPKRWQEIESEIEHEANLASMVNLPVNEVLEGGDTRRMGIKPATYQNQTSVQTMRKFKD